MRLYGTQVIKDLAVSTPHPWRRGHCEGTDRSFPLCPAFPDSLDGRHSVEYYGSAVPALALATYPPIPDGKLVQVPALLAQQFLRQP